MTSDELKQRDPEGCSLISSKLRFEKSPTNTLTLEAHGPGDDEYMSPCLITFVWAYMQTGELDLPFELEADDAVRALEYFGFPSRDVVVSKSDPRYLGKKLAHKIFLEEMKISPTIVDWIEGTLKQMLITNYCLPINFIPHDNAVPQSSPE